MIYDRINNAIREVKPNLVGIGGLCVAYKFLKDAMKIIRRATTAPIVMGGGIITYDADFIFNLFKPDFCIIGEGEKPITQLADMLESGKKDFKKIDNLGYWDSGNAIFTARNYDYPDIDDLPLPSWDTFDIKDMVDNYSYASPICFRYSRVYPKTMIILTARGCPFNCTFCVHRGDRTYRPRSIKNIMREIALSYDKYRFNILIIQDELFAANKRRIKEFCTTLIKEKKAHGWDFDWFFQTHANAKLDYDTLKLAKESGCYAFSLGLESASPTVLASMNKKTNVSQIIEAMELADSIGVAFFGNLLFGDPAETDETIQESLDFWMRYRANKFLAIVFVGPYPGSKLFDDCIERGIIKDKLQFYETIDKITWNMTTMPDELWGKWAQFIRVLALSRYLLLKSTNATRYQVDGTNLIADYGNMMMWKMWAVCPYCGKEICRREMVGDLSDKRVGAVFVTGCPHCHKQIRVNIPDNMQEVKA